jgi:hypothetical protein
MAPPFNLRSISPRCTPAERGRFKNRKKNNPTKIILVGLSNGLGIKKSTM